MIVTLHGGPADGRASEMPLPTDEEIVQMYATEVDGVRFERITMLLCSIAASNRRLLPQCRLSPYWCEPFFQSDYLQTEIEPTEREPTREEKNWQEEGF